MPLEFPADWKCDVVVHRTGGINADGDPVPATDHTVPECLVGPRATRDPIDRSEVPDTDVTLYGPPRMDITSTDSIAVPESHWMAGKYTVDGDPGFWPLGTEVKMKKVP